MIGKKKMLCTKIKVTFTFQGNSTQFFLTHATYFSFLIFHCLVKKLLKNFFFFFIFFSLSTTKDKDDVNEIYQKDEKYFYSLFHDIM